MRGFLSCMVASTISSSAIVAADTGVPPRAASADYPVHCRACLDRGGHHLIDVPPQPERRNPSGRSLVDVTTEARSDYQRSNHPVYGRQQGVGTYTAVGVEEPGRRDPPHPPPGNQIELKYANDNVAVNLLLGNP